MLGEKYFLVTEAQKHWAWNYNSRASKIACWSWIVGTTRTKKKREEKNWMIWARVRNQWASNVPRNKKEMNKEDRNPDSFQSPLSCPNSPVKVVHFSKALADDTKAVLEDSMSLLVTAKWKQNQVIQPLMSAGLLPETQIVMTMLKCVAEIKVIDPEWRQWENNKPDEIKEDREELKVSTSIFSSGLELSCRETVPK